MKQLLTMGSEISTIDAMAVTLQNTLSMSTSQLFVPTCAGLVSLGFLYGIFLTVLRGRYTSK